MNAKKLHILAATLFVSATVATATQIPIPDGSFENISTSITPPNNITIGTNWGSIGAWSAYSIGILSVGADVNSGTKASLNGIIPADGNYELQIAVPVGVATGAGIFQVLTNHFAPNSIYQLSVALDQESVAGVLGSATLSLNAGTNTVLASTSGSALASVAGSSTNFQTVTLTYATGSTVPTNGIGISFGMFETVSLLGDIYLDNFQLSVTPIQIKVGSLTYTGSTYNLSGTGGVPSGNYEVITSTNLFLPTANWTPTATNQFDGSGNFSLSFNVNKATPARFFRVCYIPN